MEEGVDVEIRPLRENEQERFLARIVETSWRDLLPRQREALSQQEMEPGIRRIVRLLMEQGDNRIFVADTPTRENVGQVWLGEGADPYTGKRRGYIYDLYVEPELQNKGIGRALLLTAEDASRQRGDTELGLAVSASNESAQALYRSCGFEVERLTLSKSLKE